MSSQETLKADEAAQFLQVKEQTLANWRCQGKGPIYTRAGSRIVYRLQDLVGFLESNKVEPANN